MGQLVWQVADLQPRFSQRPTTWQSTNMVELQLPHAPSPPHLQYADGGEFAASAGDGAYDLTDIETGECMGSFYGWLC